VAELAPRILKDVQRVVHPPSWRGEPFTIHYLLLNSEAGGAELLDLYNWAQTEGLENPRAISPQTMAWSFLFQPQFFAAMRTAEVADMGRPVRLAAHGSGDFGGAEGASTFWLQSIVFLASVTLSAAIVQGRWSQGTIASKYDRLWQAGTARAAGMTPALARLSLHERVLSLAADEGLDPLERLLSIRRLFEEAIDVLTEEEEATPVILRDSGGPHLSRFGFVDELRDVLPDLQAVIVYGSSISSTVFADYDAVLVTADSERALRRLENASPRWRGKELNLSIYTQRELWRMQLLSGDNLADYGLCVFGEAELPEKPVALLLARNLSFGMVRQRQQLGMVGAALESGGQAGDDRANLYQYFIKIPANVAKGTFGATGRRLSNEEAGDWLRARCGFDPAQQQALAREGPVAAPLASSAAATGETLRQLNEELGIVEPA
jgi:hypothetical protein